MESIASLPISVVSTVLSSDDLYNQCDFCEYQGKRYLLCTSQHQIVICCESNSTDNCNGYEIVQIIQDVHLSNSITSIRWCKNGYSQVSSRGEFAVASTSFLTIYAPISDCCISPGYNQPTWSCRGILGLDEGINHIAWSEDSSLLVVGGSTLSVWNRKVLPANASKMIEFTLVARVPSMIPISSVSLSPDYRWIATTCEKSPILQCWYWSEKELESLYLVNHELKSSTILTTTWLPLSAAPSSQTPMVLFGIHASGQLSVFEENRFSHTFILRKWAQITSSASFGWCWQSVSCTPETSLHSELFQAGHLVTTTYHLLDGEFEPNTQTLVVMRDGELAYLTITHSPPLSFSERSLTVTAEELEFADITLGLFPVFPVGKRVVCFSPDLGGVQSPLLSYQWPSVLLGEVKAAVVSGCRVFVQDGRDQVSCWDCRERVWRRLDRVPSEWKLQRVIENRVVFVSESGLEREIEWVAGEKGGVSECCISENSISEVSEWSMISDIPETSESSVISDISKTSESHNTPTWIRDLNQSTQTDKHLNLTRIGEKIIGVTDKGLKWGTVKNEVLDWKGEYQLPAIQFCFASKQNLFVISRGNLYIFAIQSDFILLSTFSVTTASTYHMTSFRDYFFLSADSDLFLFLKQKGHFKRITQMKCPETSPIRTVAFIPSGETIIVTQQSILEVSSDLHFFNGYHHYLLHEGKTVQSLTLDEYVFYENHPFPLLHPLSILHLLITQQFTVVNSLVMQLSVVVNKIGKEAASTFYLDTEDIQRKPVRLSSLESLSSTPPYQASWIEVILHNLKHVRFVELTEQEESQLKQLLLVYRYIQQIRVSKDIDVDGMHYLLYVLLLRTKMFDMDLLPYTAFLHSKLSNCQDTILTESLCLMIESRLSIVNEALVYQENETAVETPSELAIPNSQAEEVDSKYRELFTFTSNRYNITVKSQTPAVNKIEDYKTHVVWEDIRAIALPLWNKNQRLYAELALKIGMNEYKLTKNPYAGVIFFVILKKLPLLANLFRLSKQPKLECFFSRDFSTEENKRVAMKNAFVALSKQEFAKAVCFLLLADRVDDAIQTLVKNLHDPLLAMFVAVILEGESSPIYTSLLKEHLAVIAVDRKDPFLMSLTYLAGNDLDRGLAALLTSWTKIHVEEPHVSRYFKDTHSHCACYPKEYIPAIRQLSRISNNERYLEVLQYLEFIPLIHAIITLPAFHLYHLQPASPLLNEIGDGVMSLLNDTGFTHVGELLRRVYPEYFNELACESQTSNNSNKESQISSNNSTHESQISSNNSTHESQISSNNSNQESQISSNNPNQESQTITLLTQHNQLCLRIVTQFPFTTQLLCLPHLPLVQSTLENLPTSSLLEKPILLHLTFLAWQLRNDELLLNVVQAFQSSLQEKQQEILALLARIQTQTHLGRFQSFHHYTHFDEMSIHQHVLFVLQHVAYLRALHLMEESLGISKWVHLVEDEIIAYEQKLPQEIKKELLEILSNPSYAMSIFRNPISRQLLGISDANSFTEKVCACLNEASVHPTESNHSHSETQVVVSMNTITLIQNQEKQLVGTVSGSPLIFFCANPSYQCVAAATQNTHISLFDVRNQQIARSFTIHPKHQCVGIHFLSTNFLCVISTYGGSIFLTVVDQRMDNSFSRNWVSHLQLHLKPQKPFHSDVKITNVYLTTNMGVVEVNLDTKRAQWVNHV